jgi:hypothetical protein
MKRLANITFILSVLAISGCSQDAPKLPRYDRQAHYVQTQATIVLKLDELSYIQLERLHKVSMTPVIARQVNDANLSADPNVREQQEPRFDLRSFVGGSPSPVEPQIYNEYRILRNSRSPIPYTYADSIYTIAPGVYYISFVEYQNESTMYHTIAHGLNKGVITYGAFDIKPGAVLYLGDISCTWKGRNQIQKLNVTHNLVDVKNNLVSAGYQKLAEKIDIAKFYPASTSASEFNAE